MKQFADTEMTEKALGDEYKELSMPPNCEMDSNNKFWPLIEAALRDVYDPEIPVNIFELGLIYKVDIDDRDDGNVDVYVEMTLTSPACPVAQEMPMMIQSAIFPIDGVENVDVEIVWDPMWDPSMMAETAKLQLNMFT